MPSKPIRGNQINWNQLYYFCEIAREGSIKAAAQKLDLSSPTLSGHLSQLEEDLKITLFFRQHRRLKLTPEGTRLFQTVRSLFETGQRLVDVVSPIPLGCYPVSIGIVPGAVRTTAFPLLRRYLQGYSPLQVRFSTVSHEALERGLLEARFDFGFSDRRSARGDMVSKLLFSSPVRLFASPRLKGVSLAGLLSKFPLLVAHDDPAVDVLLSDLEIPPPSTVRGEDPLTLFFLCQAGQGVGVFSDAYVERMGGTLVPVRGFKDRVIRSEDAVVLFLRGAENAEAVQRLLALEKTPRGRASGVKANRTRAESRDGYSETERTI
ncbi:MAG: LysR family transcriptional regulator [Pseudomonadota bacterium]